MMWRGYKNRIGVTLGLEVFGVGKKTRFPSASVLGSDTLPSLCAAMRGRYGYVIEDF